MQAKAKVQGPRIFEAEKKNRVKYRSEKLQTQTKQFAALLEIKAQH